MIPHTLLTVPIVLAGLAAHWFLGWPEPVLAAGAMTALWYGREEFDAEVRIDRRHRANLDTLLPWRWEKNGDFIVPTIAAWGLTVAYMAVA